MTAKFRVVIAREDKDSALHTYTVAFEQVEPTEIPLRIVAIPRSFNIGEIVECEVEPA